MPSAVETLRKAHENHFRVCDRFKPFGGLAQEPCCCGRTACRECRRVYSKGSHFDRLLERNVAGLFCRLPQQCPSGRSPKGEREPAILTATFGRAGGRLALIIGCSSAWLV
jgi:hypothetical protein